MTHKSWKHLAIMIVGSCVAIMCFMMYGPSKLLRVEKNNFPSIVPLYPPWKHPLWKYTKTFIPTNIHLLKGNPDHWRTVRHHDDGGLFAFSAYYDEIEFKNPVVRIVSVGKEGRGEGAIMCKYTYKNRNNTATEPGQATEISQWGETNYTAKWIVCQLPDNDVPDTVSLITRASVHNTLLVHHKPKFSKADSGTINVCVRTLYGPYKNTTKLVEFIEFYRLLGATHFTFFSKSVSHEVSKTLGYYSRIGVATVLRYDMPKTVFVRPEGQYAIIQDCVLRSRGVHQYVALVDLDEFIIPRKHRDLAEMLSEIDTDNTSGFVFPCLIYCREFEKNRTVQEYLRKTVLSEGIKGGKLELLTQVLTKRANHPCPVPSKSKCIIKPWNVIEMQVHDIGRAAKGFTKINVQPHVATSQHYRLCPSGNYSNWRDPCPPFPYPDVDVTTHKYLSRLTTNVIRVFKKLQLKFT